VLVHSELGVFDLRYKYVHTPSIGSDASISEAFSNRFSVFAHTPPGEVQVTPKFLNLIRL